MTRHDDSRPLRILDFIQSAIEDEGFPPSVREITDAVGLASTSATHHHLNRLEAAGLIRRRGGKSRAVAVTDLGREALGV